MAQFLCYKLTLNRPKPAEFSQRFVYIYPLQNATFGGRRSGRPDLTWVFVLLNWFLGREQTFMFSS